MPGADIGVRLGQGFPGNSTMTQATAALPVTDPRAHALRARFHAEFAADELPVPVEAITEDLLGLRVEDGEPAVRVEWQRVASAAELASRFGVSEEAMGWRLHNVAVVAHSPGDGTRSSAVRAKIGSS